VLARGTYMPPWGSNPHPYIEASYFRLQHLSIEQQSEQEKIKAKK